MTAPDSANRGLKRGLLLTLLLDLVATLMAFGINLVLNINMFSAGATGLLMSALAWAWVAQLIYLPLAALVVALIGKGSMAKGIFLGLGVGLIAIPSLCGGVAGFGY